MATITYSLKSLKRGDTIFKKFFCVFSYSANGTSYKKCLKQLALLPPEEYQNMSIDDFNNLVDEWVNANPEPVEKVIAQFIEGKLTNQTPLAELSPEKQIKAKSNHIKYITEGLSNRKSEVCDYSRFIPICK